MTVVECVCGLTLELSDGEAIHLIELLGPTIVCIWTGRESFFVTPEISAPAKRVAV
jgi:hypothetical protein